ncbi:hypothetical protein RchiOBHm_Chr5g0019841 [Rosa chinensis]|uniref:Uncharacterized protein n=1 Tax=Rosa chinensis TaxID=74649 RepID=A0A2P6Q753_ROSCH|nr:hypothetical protein RchiOBHm_Chr5g0019841 [Rosa chinensis]
MQLLHLLGFSIFMDKIAGFGLLLFLFFLFASTGVLVSPRMAFAGSWERDDWFVLLGSGGGVFDRPPHLRYRKLGIGDMQISNHVTQNWAAGDGETEELY